MNNLENDFLPYELTLALNELGYNKPTIFFDNQLLYRNGKFCQANQDAIDMFKDWGDELVIALTFSQAFKFFRDRFKLKGDVTHAISNGKFTYTIWKWNFDNNIGEWERIGIINSWFTYEEAEIACLNKLIEICKKQL